MTATKRQVMLAQKVKELSSLTYPLWGSPKLDGIRCFINQENEPVSRTFLPIPNRHVSSALSGLPAGLDGELMVIGESGLNGFNAVQSAVMSRDGTPDFCYMVFDYCPTGEEATPFLDRYKMLQTLAWTFKATTIVPHQRLDNVEQAEAYETLCLQQGHEGICLRSPAGFYKSGRSTLRQQWLLKVKRFTDAEASVVGYEEMMHNDNEAFESEVGLTKRSKAQAGLRPAGVLGKLKCIDLITGADFAVGSGFTADQRRDLWANKETLIDRVLTYKYQPHGTELRPRSPVFITFRSPLDL